MSTCIGSERRRPPRCYHCDERVDSAQHTLEHFLEERHALTAEIEVNPSASAVLRSLLSSESGRRAIASFCDALEGGRGKEKAAKLPSREDRYAKTGQSP
jgi:hypothetical protein